MSVSEELWPVALQGEASRARAMCVAGLASAVLTICVCVGSHEEEGRSRERGGR